MCQIRIIVECQNRTLFRGPNSIFSRLRKERINVRGSSLSSETLYLFLG